VDVLVVTKFDRCARSVADLYAIVEKIERKSASFRILAMNPDSATPTGRLIVNNRLCRAVRAGDHA
jgi:DNA invertase Pin-like site-specific DNA recombinase